MKKYICLGLLFCFFQIGVHAQEERGKKVVIITKMTDENGVVSESRQEAFGDEADSLLIKIKEDPNLESMDVEIAMEMGNEHVISGSQQLEITDTNGKKSYKLVKEENGEKQVFVWEGEGEMPKEIEEALDKMEIDETLEGKDGQTFKTITVDKKRNQRVHEQVHRDIHRGRNWTTHSEDQRLKLGVFIESTDEGVIVKDVIKDSPADNAGLQRGDTILKIGDKYIFTGGTLINTIDSYNAGDQIEITYIRNGEEHNSTTTLEER